MTRRQRVLLAAALVLVPLLAGAAGAQQRFPPPEFESGHELPTMTRPHPVQTWREVVDVGVLAGALSVGAYLALRRRSRRGILWLSVFSLAYFGFYRAGCICPVGSVQNVALSLADSTYAVPLTVVLYFALPLAFALLFGRVFCGGVCPLGAIQDLVCIRTVRVPSWLDRALGLLPHAYLGLAVLYVVTGTAFYICQYDPFVGIFRLSGGLGLLLLGAGLLALSTVVGRPYCRYLCPYSVLLGLCSRVAWRRTTITPDVCVTCGLCEEACPFGAIEAPAPVSVREEA